MKRFTTKKIAPFLTAAVLLLGVQSVSAAMSSSNYRIDWDTLSNGGSDTGSSASYQLRDSIGVPVIGQSTGSTLDLQAGYRAGIDDLLLAFEVFPQDTSTEVAASALVGTTVTITSSSGFSVNDYAAVVQNVGDAQVSAFGRITATTATSLTFDSLVNGGSAPVIDGSDDVVYLLSGDTVSFGSLNDGDFRTAVIGFEATVISDNGYSIQLFENSDLQDGSNDIDDVTDGSVSTASEEYGARSSDTTIATSSFDTQDTAISTALQAVSTTSSTSYNDRHFVTLKTAVDADTENGSYAQTLTFIATGNY